MLLVAGTDAPYPGVLQAEGIHRESELLIEAGLTPIEAISAPTRNAARLMRAEEEWGTLAPGKVANNLVVRARPDVNTSESRNVEMVIQEGRISDRASLKFDVNKDPGFRIATSVASN